MSLLSTDLRTVKKLSLKGVRLPITEREPEPTIYPPSPEEKAYSKLVAKTLISLSTCIGV